MRVYETLHRKKALQVAYSAMICGVKHVEVKEKVDSMHTNKGTKYETFYEVKIYKRLNEQQYAEIINESIDYEISMKYK